MLTQGTSQCDRGGARGGEGGAGPHTHTRIGLMTCICKDSQRARTARPATGEVEARAASPTFKKGEVKRRSAADVLAGLSSHIILFWLGVNASSAR